MTGKMKIKAPEKISGHTATLINEDMLVIFGGNRIRKVRCIHLNFPEDWYEIQGLDYKHYGHTANLIGNLIYLLAGHRGYKDDNGKFNSDDYYKNKDYFLTFDTKTFALNSVKVKEVENILDILHRMEIRVILQRNDIITALQLNKINFSSLVGMKNTFKECIGMEKT